MRVKGNSHVLVDLSPDKRDLGFPFSTVLAKITPNWGKKKMKKQSMNSSINTPREQAAVSGKKKTKMGRKQLMKYEDLPEYLKDNEYIRNHYRCEWPLKDVALSIFSLHNETFNIWTHVVGFVIFGGMMVMSLTDKMTPSVVGGRSNGWLTIKMLSQFSSPEAFLMGSNIPGVPVSHASKVSVSVPLWPWFVFLVGAISCLSFSSVSHLLACHSQPFSYFFWCLDYAGIAIMIVCSFFTPIYYIFSDHPYWRFFYLAAITLIGILVVVVLFAPGMSSGRFRSFRTTLFLCMGFSGVIPAIHGIIIHWGQSQVLVTLAYEIAMGLLYAIGAGFYVSRIPERWKPGAFDIVGQSHQIFHILIVAAALSHSAACLNIMEWRRGFLAEICQS